MVVYALACKLETNSACLSILFDRFGDEELERIRSSLERIGAARTLADLGELQALFQDSLAAGSDRLDAAELVQEQSNARGIDGRSEAHVEEMEKKLLQFCEAHLEELAAG